MNAHALRPTAAALSCLLAVGLPFPASADEKPNPRAVVVEEVRNARPAFHVRVAVDRPDRVYRGGDEIKVAARIRRIDEYSGHADGPELARWIAARRPVRRGVFLVHGEEYALAGPSDRIAERTIPASQIFRPLLDDVYELSTSAPTPIDVTHRRRLAPEAVVALDWHNDMSKLILDINDRIEAAADDRSRGVIIRRLRRALEAEH